MCPLPGSRGPRPDHSRRSFRRARLFIVFMYLANCRDYSKPLSRDRFGLSTCKSVKTNTYYKTMVEDRVDTRRARKTFIPLRPWRAYLLVFGNGIWLFDDNSVIACTLIESITVRFVWLWPRWRWREHCQEQSGKCDVTLKTIGTWANAFTQSVANNKSQKKITDFF